MSSFASTESGTKIHVKERFRPGLLLKFYQKLRGMMVEEVLIRERCQYARTSILLAEEEIARGLHLPRGAVGMVPIAGPEISGLAWHVPHSKHSAATLVSNGVSIVELPMDHGPQSFTAVVEGARLLKDVSQSNFVQDGAYQEVLDAIEAARDASLAAIATLAGGQLVPPATKVWALSTVKKALYEIRSLKTFRSKNPASFARIAAGLPLWKTATQDLRPVTFQELHKQVKRVGVLPTSFKEYEGRNYKDGLLVVLLESRYDREFFQRLFRNEVKNIHQSMERAAQCRRNREQWLARKAEPRLGQGLFLARYPICTDSMIGEIGVRYRGGEPSVIKLIASGHLLCELESSWALPHLKVVVEADFTPTKSFDNVRKNKLLANCLLEIVRALDPLMRAVRAQLPVRWGIIEEKIFKSHLERAIDLEFPVRVLTTFGFTERSAKRYVKGFDGLKGFWLPRLGVGLPHFLAGVGTDGNEARGKLHPLTSVPLFPT